MYSDRIGYLVASPAAGTPSSFLPEHSVRIPFERVAEEFAPAYELPAKTGAAESFVTACVAGRSGQAWLKRIIDLSASVFALIFLAPLLILVSLLIFAFDPGP